MSLIITETRDAIGTIVMNHEQKRNALSEALIGAITTALRNFRGERVRAVVLRAPPGTKLWCAGHHSSDCQEGLNAMRDKRKPRFTGQ